MNLLLSSVLATFKNKTQKIWIQNNFFFNLFHIFEGITKVEMWRLTHSTSPLSILAYLLCENDDFDGNVL